MLQQQNITTSVQRTRLYRMAGSSSVVSSLWQGGDEASGWNYHFNLFRMPAETGRASHLFTPDDFSPLLKVCRELAIVLAEAPAIDPRLREELESFAARLAVVFRTEA